MLQANSKGEYMEMLIDALVTTKEAASLLGFLIGRSQRGCRRESYRGSRRVVGR